jgi:hypothetical protein
VLIPFRKATPIYVESADEALAIYEGSGPVWVLRAQKVRALLAASFQH